MGQLFNRLSRLARAELRRGDGGNQPHVDVDAYMHSDDDALRKAIDDLQVVADDPQHVQAALRELGLAGKLHDYTFDDVKRAYAGKVRYWHPDVYADASVAGRKLAEMHLININAAFEVLKHEYE